MLPMKGVAEVTLPWFCANRTKSRALYTQYSQLQSDQMDSEHWLPLDSMNLLEAG